MAMAEDIASRVKPQSTAAKKYDPTGNDSLVAPADKGETKDEDMAVDHGRLILSAIAAKDPKALKEAIRDCVADMNSGEDY